MARSGGASTHRVEGDLASGVTDRGMVRSSNQDAFMCQAKDRIYVVADGMGGHAGGEIASQMAVKVIYEDLIQELSTFQDEAARDDHRLRQVARAINHASTQIFERALEEPDLKGMGTTATVVVLGQRGTRVYWGHVGDSRLYLVRCGFIYRITQDHSLVGEQLRAGLISDEEAESHTLRNVITRSVGYQEEEEVDVGFFDVQPKDFLVLCSDGLYGKVADLEISKMVQKHTLDAGLPLVQLANARGGEDNITVVLVCPQVGP